MFHHGFILNQFFINMGSNFPCIFKAAVTSRLQVNYWVLSGFIFDVTDFLAAVR